VVQYRSFRNDDPPALRDIWNESFTGRGAVILRHTSPLERCIFSKPYFDPAGLIVADEDGLRVGFAHAGFAANCSETALSMATGVVCAIGVRASHRRRGIGSALLQHCETYLRQRGARTIYAGCMRPFNPFYFGLYGGSDSPGFLVSDKAAAPFLESRGYRHWDTCLVFQRRLDRPVAVLDPRFGALRRDCGMRVYPRSGIATWWQECVLDMVEPLVFRLEDHGGATLGHAEVWEMEDFSWRWGTPAIGILDLTIADSQRRRGLAKFLLAGVIQYWQDQYFGLIEAHAMERNLAALHLYQGLGFEQMDVGRVYRREAS
jgi:ribosomal protein S18 acetylase RimI-like enzyme